MRAGAADRLSGEDAEILGLETEAIKGHKSSVLVLEPAADGTPLDIEELRASIASRLGSERRARQVVMETPMKLGRPAWVDYGEFDLSAHVVHAAAVDESDHGVRGQARGEHTADASENAHPPGEEAARDVAALRELTARLMSERLDHRKPMWTIHAVDLSGGRTGLVLRIHHCIADGIGTLRFLGGILWDPEPEPEMKRSSESERAAGRSEPWVPIAPPSSLELVFSGVADRALALVSGAVSAARSVGNPRGLRESLDGLARMPGALIRELRPRATEGTRFDRLIGSRRDVAWLRRPIAELKAIGAAHSNGGHVTINDVLLAGLTGGIRTWLGGEATGERMRVKVPVSMHRRDTDADAIGNRDSFLFVDLPLDEPDPVQRLRRINMDTSERKAHHDADALYGFFQGISHLSPLHREVAKASMSPREFTLAASNVPGPREPRWVLGRPVSELYSVTEPAARHALRVSAISLDDHLAISLCTDPDALEGVDRLAAWIEAAFDELVGTA